jgi:hypothetical protein
MSDVKEGSKITGSGTVVLLVQDNTVRAIAKIRKNGIRLIIKRIYALRYKITISGVVTENYY